MSGINRRLFLSRAPVAAAALALPAAVLADDGPDLSPIEWPEDRVDFSVRPPELPHERVHRLARELSRALGKWEGFKQATITPDRVMFTDADATLARIEGRKVERLIERHQKAWLAYEAACPAADEDDPRYGGLPAENRAATLCVREQKALSALLECPVENYWARNRKITYLLCTMGPGGRWQPEQDHVVRLLGSFL